MDDTADLRSAGRFASLIFHCGLDFKLKLAYMEIAQPRKLPRSFLSLYLDLAIAIFHRQIKAR